MKKNSNFFADDYADFQPKKQKQKRFKSNQVSFSELDYDKDYDEFKKRKNVNYKQY